MKKYNFVFCIIIFILSFNSFVFASDSNEKIDLTLDEAVEKAVKYSRELKTINENIDSSVDKVSTISEQVVSATDSANILNLAVRLKEIRYDVDYNKLSADTEKRKIRISVLEYFTDVLNAERSLKLFDESIVIEEKNLKITEEKAKLGVISEDEYKTQMKEYKQKLLNRDSQEASIKEAFIALNNIIGGNKNTSYNLILDVNYEELGDIDLDSIVNNAQKNSLSIIKKENEAEIAKADYEVFYSSVSSSTKEKVEVEYYRAERSLNEEKENLKQKIYNTYNEIVTCENNYKSKTSELDKMQSELEVKKAQYELGYITETELNQCIYDIDSLKSEIQSAVYNHYILTEKLLNADLL